MTTSDWIALVGVLAPVLGAALAFVYRLMGERVGEVERQSKAIGEKLDTARADLAAFKLQVAKEYASVDYLQEVERRITDGFKELKADLKDGLASLARQLDEAKR